MARSNEASEEFPPPRVQQTIKTSKNTVRTGVLIGHTARYLITSVSKPGTSLLRSKKITVRMEVFVGQGIRWTGGSVGCGEDGVQRVDAMPAPEFGKRALAYHSGVCLLPLGNWDSAGGRDGLGRYDGPRVLKSVGQRWQQIPVSRPFQCPYLMNPYLLTPYGKTPNTLCASSTTSTTLHNNFKCSLTLHHNCLGVSLRGPGQSPVLPFACCVGSLLSVGRCGRQKAPPPPPVASSLQRTGQRCPTLSPPKSTVDVGKPECLVSSYVLQTFVPQAPAEDRSACAAALETVPPKQRSPKQLYICAIPRNQRSHCPPPSLLSSHFAHQQVRDSAEVHTHSS